MLQNLPLSKIQVGKDTHISVIWHINRFYNIIVNSTPDGRVAMSDENEVSVGGGCCQPIV